MSDKVVTHYSYWGNHAVACKAINFTGGWTGNPLYVTCPKCKDSEAWKNHVVTLEIAFDGNIGAFTNSLKENYFKGISNE